MYILMIRHKHGGHRSFPKGHVEEGETEHQTAIREVEEETAVRIRITSDFCEKVHYSPMPGVQKEVVYFMAMTDQKATHPHDGEIADVEWVPLDNAERSLTHENDKIVLRAAMKALRETMV
jgi:8-oxo-dGTP pyrophosphatase MutT (NUDIX family)